MVRAYERWRTVSTMGNRGGWVYRVASNWATSRLRRRKPLTPASSDDWIPMATDGTETQPDEQSFRLKEAIVPQSGDRFFPVPVEGGDVVILIRQTMAHAYSETCQSLASLDLPPGIGRTCLE